MQRSQYTTYPKLIVYFHIIARISVCPFLDELKRDPDHATAAATTKRPVPHAAAQLSDGLAHAQRGRGPAALPPRSPPVPSSLTATTATDQQPIKQQYAAAATDNVLLVHGER